MAIPNYTNPEAPAGQNGTTDPDPPVGVDPERWAQMPQEVKNQWKNASPQQRQQFNQQQRAKIQQKQAGPLSSAAVQRQNTMGALGQIQGGGGQGQPQQSQQEMREQAKLMLKETAPALSDPLGTFKDMMGEAQDILPEVQFTEEDELEGIDLDLSQINESIDEFAKAKVQAAKQGARTSRVTAQNANMQMMLNALGPGLMQALTGVSQPSFQPGNQQRAAQSAINQYQQAITQAQQTEATAGAQAEVQKAEQDLQAQQTQQKSQMQADRFNTQMAKQIEQQNQSQQVNLASSLTKMSQSAQQNVFQAVTDRMEAMSEEEGTNQIPGSVTRMTIALGGATEARKEARFLNSMYQELNEMPSKLFGHFDKMELDQYAAEKIARQRGTTAEQVMTDAQEDDQLAQDLDAIKQNAREKYNMLTDHLAQRGAHYPSVGLSGALGMDKETMADNVKSRVETLNNEADRLFNTGVTGLTSEDGFSPLMHKHLQYMSNQFFNVNNGDTNQQRDNVEDDTSSSSGVNVQGDLGF